MCEAAQIPVILATQVLETLAKSGLPTRAEITDAAMGQRAECVMLNKGTHILEVVKTLSGLLSAEDITLRSVMCFENLQSSVACLEIKREDPNSWIIMYWNACSLQVNNTSPFPGYK